jgi:HPt (histidine-containing phosphotransfer) domain-containing protein
MNNDQMKNDLNSTMIIFNEKKFLDNYQDVEEIIPDLIENFLSTSPSVLSKLKKSIDEKNYKEVELYAHTMKGAISNFYSENGRLLFEKIEKNARDNNLTNIDDIYQEGFKVWTDLSGILRDLALKIKKQS